MRVGLNIGCGKDFRESTPEMKWWNLDGDVCVRADIHSKVTTLSLMWPRDVDEIVANDILEHVPLHCWYTTLSWWVGLLRPGGTIRIQVPNLRNICEAFDTGKIKEETANRVIYGECTNEFDRHYQLFTNHRLEAALIKCGLKIVESSDLHVNIVVIARKP